MKEYGAIQRFIESGQETGQTCVREGNNEIRTITK